MGTSADYALFTSVGAVTNSGTGFLTKITGNVGTNSGIVSGFGNVNGVMTYAADALSSQCAADLLLASNFLEASIPDSTIGLVIGNGDTLKAGIYLMPGVASLNLNLVLDAQGNENALFIFKTALAFSTSANSKVILINGAKACNVFWKLNGAVDFGAGTTMRGTIVSGGAISMNSNDTLEGRALTINGAILTNGVTINTPIGCGSPNLTGPIAPSLNSTACFALFTSIGAFTDDSQSFINGGGNLGNNSGAVTGFDPLKITGAQYSMDGFTSLGSSDLLDVYNEINLMPEDIELLYPPQFGHNLVLTPHTYIMKAAVTFTDSLYLDALGDENAVFVIKVNGAFETSVNSRVILMNGAKPENIFWKIDGAVSIGDYSIFNGTIIAYGALNLLTGVELNGRALVVDGELHTFAIILNTPPGCGIPPTGIDIQPNDTSACVGDSAMFIVSASGTGITYQWRKGTVNLVDGGNISGATNDTLIIFPVSIADTASNYNVVINGNPDQISDFVSLTLNSEAIIITEPENQTSCVGGLVNFSINATGTGLSYQWRNGLVDLIEGGNISGSQTNMLEINNVAISDTSSFYNVVVTGDCASIVTSINVSLLLGATTTNNPQTICEGSSYVFNGNTYTLAGDYNDTLTSINGCDSVIVTQLLVTLTSSTNNPQTICEGSSYVFNGNTYTLAGDYNDTLTSVNGCDSVIVTQLLVTLTTTTDNPQTICEGSSYVFNGNTYTIAGDYNDTLTSINGCDSVIVTQLLVTLTTTTNNPQTICEGSSYVFIGNTYTIAGDYNDTLTSINGCDSVIVTQLLVTLTTTTNNPQTICEGSSYVFIGNTYTIAGDYNDTLTSINGCDSVIVTQLLVTLTTTTNNPQTICEGSSYVFNGNTYTIAGNYNDTLTSVNACDSVIVTQLSVNLTTSTNNPQTICEGSSYVFNGNTYSIAGDYNDTLTSVNGCDSVIVTQLLVTLTTTTNNPQTICNSKSYNINGHSYFIAGIYNDTLISVNGCDSIIVTQLSVNLTTSTNNPQTICEGSSYVFNGNTYTIVGNYNDTLSSINGCDSVIVTQISMTALPIAVASSNSPVCVDETMNLNAETILGATYSWTGPNGYLSSEQNSIINSASIADMGDYSLVISLAGCISEPTTFMFVVNKCLFVDFYIPEGFSPNGDNINDLFVITGIENFTSNKFVIFNRWGNKVFEANNYQNTWDGKSTLGITIGGDELPVATYFYVLDLGDGSDVYKGTIYLNR
ncbi:MAG: hypothetical protein A2W98_13300 [Bacteroidetes bacterium GWF2_33_38]|nr:MAG: hypothetical protein A2W98_13300 [Bacteroidetes bacterium GWF2_33_38]